MFGVVFRCFRFRVLGFGFRGLEVLGVWRFGGLGVWRFRGLGV